jgi:pimeloyl-ACP methyl ester carboxylesterase
MMFGDSRSRALDNVIVGDHDAITMEIVDSRLTVAALIFSCACGAHNAAAVAEVPAASASRNDRVVELLVHRDYAKLEALFEPETQAAVPADKVESAWRSLTEGRGNYRGTEDTRSFAAPTGEVEVSLLGYAQGKIVVRVGWSKDARIQSLYVRPGEVHARALGFARSVLSGDASGIYGRFSPAMKAALSSSKFEQTLDQVRAQLGEAPSVHDIDVESGKFDVATVQCRGKAGGFDLRLTLRKQTDQLEGLYFLPPNTSRPDEAPPPYANSTRYEEREVAVNGLPATLLMPHTDELAAAVVLVYGSGPQDRDETVIANKPFRDLALGLATRGLAVLRYEKRTYGKNLATLRDPANITFDEETVDDAVAAVQLLLNTTGVDPTRVIVVGHSQGAMAAPRIAEREPRVRGLVLLAPPARPLEDLLLDQNRYLASVDTSNRDAAQAALAQLEKQIERVKSADLASATPEELPMSIPASWWLSLRGYSPTELAIQVRKPTLLLQGDRDFQVTQTDLELWKAAFAGQSWATIRVLPGLNHLFERWQGAPSIAEYGRPGHVSGVVISQIADWILALQPPPAAAPAKPTKR